MRAEIFIYESLCDRSPTLWNVRGSSLCYPHAQHPCYYDPPRGISHFAPWQPSARNIIAGRTVIWVLICDIQGTQLFNTLAMMTELRVVRTSVSLRRQIVDVCAIRDQARVERVSYCKVYCHYTQSFWTIPTDTQTYTPFRRNMRTTGKVLGFDCTVQYISFTRSVLCHWQSTPGIDHRHHRHQND